MALEDDFKKAQSEVMTLRTRPSNTTLLELYALFKQGTEGDVAGSRPGLLDLKGRAKFDVWSSKRGMTRDAARQAYVDLVRKLLTV